MSALSDQCDKLPLCTGFDWGGVGGNLKFFSSDDRDASLKELDGEVWKVVDNNFC